MKIQTFDFEEAAVRVLTREDQPWFVAADVCRVLSLSNPTVVLQKLDDDERAKFNLGRQGNTNMVNESGLYTLILRCDDAIKPGTTAHRFRKWVTAEVLPALRKAGAYSLAKAAESDERARRLEGVKGAVVHELHEVNSMARYAQEHGALGGRMPMTRVREVYRLGRLRLEAMRMLWEVETGTAAGSATGGSGGDDDDEAQLVEGDL